MHATRRAFLSLVGFILGCGATTAIRALFDGLHWTADANPLEAAVIGQRGRIIARPSTHQGVLFKATPRGVDRLKLVKVCMPPLARMLSDLFIWKARDFGRRWRVGDVNVLIVETWVDPKTVLYVQFISEPMEVVLNEVCSGNANPEAAKHIAEVQAAGLLRCGFEIGGQVRNFTREVTIRDSGDARRLAAEVLGIFYDIFRYRGHTALEFTIIRDRRPQQAPAYQGSGLANQDPQRLEGSHSLTPAERA